MNNYFRVDKRIFKTGDIITSNSTYFEGLSDEKKSVERILDQNGAKTERKNCLFLFFELKDALQHSIKFGGNIYVVTNIQNRFHTGDINKIDNIFDIIRLDNGYNYGQLIKHLGRRYWIGDKTFTPCLEILVESAEIVKEIFNEKDRYLLTKEYNEYEKSIERTPTYISLLNLLYTNRNLSR